MDLAQLEHFVAAVELGSLSRAARAHFISQPTLSRQMQALENELGVSLFERKGRHLSLTEAGEVFLAGVRSSLNELKRASLGVAQVKEGSSGFLRIVVPAPAMQHVALPALIEFRQRAPHVRVQIVEADFGTAPSMLENGNVHLAVGVLLPISRRLRWEILSVGRMMALMKPSHHLADRPYITIDDLTTEDLLLVKSGRSTRFLYGITFYISGFHPHSVLESSNHGVLLKLAENGFGIAILTDTIPYSGYNLVAVPVMQDGRQPAAKVAVAWDPQRPLPECGKLFISILKKQSSPRSAQDYDPWRPEEAVNEFWAQEYQPSL